MQPKQVQKSIGSQGRLLQTLVIFMLLGSLSGCASLSREQCQTGDWYGIGMSDGLNGQPVSRLGQHMRACADYGIVIERQRYLDGHSQGMRNYCRIENAFELGLRGQRYQGGCSPGIDAFFDHANRTAYDVYRLRQELNSIAYQRDRKEDKLHEYGLPHEQRHRLRHAIEDLDRHYAGLRYQLGFSEQELERLRMESYGR